MDFKFIGGSMGSSVGEKIAKSIKLALEKNCSLIIVCQSGGARMQEGALSLMQLSKVSAHLSNFSKKGGLYISVLTYPTTGGVTASFGMQADITIAEPKALIGFAGQRVIKQTTSQDLPEGFQTSEFLMEKGFVDLIVDRNSLKNKLINILSVLK
jgi:acetyl-CoA carboxylase carboxyl transferase subunit beta